MKSIGAGCCASLLLCSLVFAEDFKTLDGKEYKDATVSRVEPDGIVLKTKSGISKVYFSELPKEVQERFHYDPEKSASYSAEQNAAGQQYRKQQEQALQQQAAQQQQEETQKRIVGESKELYLEILQVLPNGVLADPLEEEYV